MNNDNKEGIKKIGELWNTDLNKRTIIKQASAAAGSVSLTSAQFYTPELTPETWLLPKSRQEVLRWARIYFNLEPYIQSIIMFHSRYPFSKFKLIGEDKEIIEYFNDIVDNERWNLYEFILQASLSYHLYGEAIPMGEWDEKEKKWKKFILLEPELIEVKQGLFDDKVRFELILTDEIKKQVNDPNVDTSKIPEAMIEAIKSNKNVKLDNENVSMIARLTSPSALRGTPIIQCLFKILIYQDYIRLAQMKIAERHQLPFELWTLGNIDKNILPSDEDLENFKSMLNSAIQNPPFSMVYPPIVDYKVLGVKDKLLNIYEDLGYVENQILVGLGVNKNLILGEGPSFSNTKTISLNKLMMEYQIVRDTFERWIYNHVFRRVSEENNFFIHKGKFKKLILPKIEWEKSLRLDEDDERKVYQELHSKGFVSTKTLFSKFSNLDYDMERRQLEEEKGTIYDKTDGKRIPEKFDHSKDEVRTDKTVGTETGLTPPPPPLAVEETQSESPLPEMNIGE